MPGSFIHIHDPWSHQAAKGRVHFGRRALRYLCPGAGLVSIVLMKRPYPMPVHFQSYSVVKNVAMLASGLGLTPAYIHEE